jgi:hypothetical protein
MPLTRSSVTRRPPSLITFKDLAFRGIIEKKDEDEHFLDDYRAGSSKQIEVSPPRKQAVKERETCLMRRANVIPDLEISRTKR